MSITITDEADAKIAHEERLDLNPDLEEEEEEIGKQVPGLGMIVAIYPYEDTKSVHEEGWRRPYQQVRFAGKKFRPRYFEPEQHKYIYAMPDTGRLLYRLSEIVDADQVFIVEGEKDADRLAAEGLPATTSGGRSTWPENEKRWHELFQGKEVVILRDNDDPGLAYANTIVNDLQDVVKSIKVLNLMPDVEKADVSDWLAEEENDIAELQRLVELAPTYEREEDKKEEKKEDKEKEDKPTPAELAEEFFEEHSDEDDLPLLRYYKNRWYSYTGTHYAARDDSIIDGQLFGFFRRNYPKTTGSAANTVVRYLREPDLCGTPAEAQKPCWLYEDGPESAEDYISLQSDVVHVPSKLRKLQGEDVDDDDIRHEHTPGLFSTWALPYDYDPDATCPKFDEYLAGVQPKAEDREVLQMLAGLMLIPQTRYNVAFILYGEGGTGKSVFLYILEELVGQDNCCNLPLEQLKSKFSSHSLTEKLLNTFNEMPQEDGRGYSMKGIEDMLKMASDGGKLRVEEKYQKPFDAPITARNVFATNSLPRFADKSTGIWDRLRIIAFDQVFRGSAKENPDLRQQIVDEEMSGVFNWAMEGLAKLLPLIKFPEHSKGEKLKEELREDSDTVRSYLLDKYELGNAGDFVHGAQAYGHFKEWIGQNGFGHRSSKTFEKAIQRVFKKKNKPCYEDGRTQRGYKGLREKVEERGKDIAYTNVDDCFDE